MSDKETVTITLEMLESDVDALVRAYNADQPLVANIEHHAEPIDIAFGELTGIGVDPERDE